jgi:hypothetical protein
MSCYVLATRAAFSKGIFVGATNSANQTNKAGSRYVLLFSLSFLDVYGLSLSAKFSTKNFTNEHEA